MRRYITMLVVTFMSFALSSGAMAQEGVHNTQNAINIPARDLAIGLSKTCMLVFPAAIQSADRGAAYVLAEKVKGSENVLKVKAASPDFAPSSLTVITADGRIFAFKVFYEENPSCLALDLSGASFHSAAVKFGGGFNSEVMQRAVMKVKGSGPFLKGLQVHKYGLDCRLEGSYIDRDVLFFKFRLHNTSNIGYSLASLRFFIRDLRTAKRTAVQDNELKPLYMQTWGMPEDEVGQEIVVAMHRFTIADSKSLVIELTEKDGDRSLSFRLKERKLRETRKL